jgi:cytochrome b561
MAEVRPNLSSALTARVLEPQRRYDTTSIVLHWLMAAVILFDWLVGQGRNLVPGAGTRADAISLHILIGTIIGALLVARLAWRARAGRRFEYEAGPLGFAARAAHMGLYVLITATVLAGLAVAATYKAHLFGVTFPALGLHGVLIPLARLHSVLADLLGLLAVAHALAALAHHFMTGDEVLLRMAPFLPSWFGSARRGRSLRGVSGTPQQNEGLRIFQAWS